MGKFVIIALVLSLNFSVFAYTDKCGLINLINYKQNYYEILSKIQNYPILFGKVNNLAVKIFSYCGNNSDCYYNLIQVIIDYSYTNNLCSNSKAYIALSYLDYVLYDKYLTLTLHKNGVERLLQYLNLNSY